MQKIARTIMIFSISFSTCFAESYLWDILLNQNKEVESLGGVLKGNKLPACRVTNNNFTSPINDETNDLALKCAFDLCGPADQIENYKEMLYRFVLKDIPDSEKGFVEKYNELAERIFDSSLERNKILQPIYKKIIKENEIEMSEKGWRLTAIMNISMAAIKFVFDEYALPENESNPIFDIVEKNGLYSLVFNEEKLKNNLNRDFKIDPYNIQLAIKVMAKDKMFRAVLLDGLGVPVPAILNELEDGNDWKEAFKKLALESNSQMDEIQKEYSSYIDEEDLGFIGEDELKNIIDGHFPKQEVMADKLRDIYFTSFVTKILSKPNDHPEFFEKPNIEKMVIAKAKIFDWDKRLEGLKAVKKVNKRRRLDLVQCKSQRDFALSALPKKDDINGLGKLISSTKDAFKNKLFSKFSKESSKVLLAEIDKLHFIPPMTQEDYKKNILKDMQENADGIREEIQNLKKGFGPKYEGVLISNMPSSVEDDSFFDDEEELTKNVHDLMDECDNYTPETLNDSYSSFKVGSIYISWNSVRSKDFGHSVLYHELGHAISPFFKSGELSKKSTKKYENTRACLNQNHGMEKKSEDELYTEEDWADFVSSVIAKDNDKNIGCFLMSQIRNKYDSDYISLENSDTDDTHSADFYRILQIHLFRNNNYPNSCKKWLAKQSSPYPKENCRDEINKKL